MRETRFVGSQFRETDSTDKLTLSPSILPVRKTVEPNLLPPSSRGVADISSTPGLDSARTHTLNPPELTRKPCLNELYSSLKSGSENSFAICSRLKAYPASTVSLSAPCPCSSSGTPSKILLAKVAQVTESRFSRFLIGHLRLFVYFAVRFRRSCFADLSLRRQSKQPATVARRLVRRNGCDYGRAERGLSVVTTSLEALTRSSSVMGRW